MNERVSGCETLFYHSSTKGRKYAQLFSDTISEINWDKKRNNGLKPLYNSNDRGFASVYYTTAPTIEPFFGSNKSDCEKIQSPDNIHLIGEFIKSVLKLVYGGLAILIVLFALFQQCEQSQK